MLSFWSQGISATGYTCTTLKDTFKDGDCNGVKFTTKQCLSESMDKTTETNKYAVLSVDLLSECENLKATYDANILSPGCDKMGGILETPTECVKQTLCEHLQEAHRESSACTIDTDCPATPKTNVKPC